MTKIYDAIIVGENIFSHYERGKPHTTAVIDGLAEVGGPVVMAIATTVVGFTPLLFISGIMGKFIAVMPAAVIAILLFSLFEALIILPAHLNLALARTRRTVLYLRPIQGRVPAGVATSATSTGSSISEIFW